MSPGSKRQSGFTFLELIAVVVTLGVLAFAAYIAATGTKAEAEISDGTRFIVANASSTLGQVYMTTDGSYNVLRGASFDQTASRNALIQRGMPRQLPWGQEWVVVDIPAGAQSVTVDWRCSALRLTCEDLRAAVQARVSADPLAHTSVGARGIQSVGLEGADDTEAVRVVYGRPS
ncbi:type II secretion system protein [Flagellatimonas centrodinii]|uniref:type II secretion system protein n=1 Tax=Flagellatimonas centrodinii TaxID=2806210 RepID=UPI00344FC221